MPGWDGTGECKAAVSIRGGARLRGTFGSVPGNERSLSGIGFRSVRRLLSITLLLLLVLPSLAATLLQNTDANVPVCCRAKGNHHCMMLPELVTRDGMAVRMARERCPAFPKWTAWVSSPLSPAALAQSGISVVVISPNAILQAEAHYRFAWSRSRQRRGPPSLLS